MSTEEDVLDDLSFQYPEIPFSPNCQTQDPDLQRTSKRFAKPNPKPQPNGLCSNPTQPFPIEIPSLANIFGGTSSQKNTVKTSLGLSNRHPDNPCSAPQNVLCCLGPENSGLLLSVYRCDIFAGVSACKTSLGEVYCCLNVIIVGIERWGLMGEVCMAGFVD